MANKSDKIEISTFTKAIKIVSKDKETIDLGESRKTVTQLPVSDNRPRTPPTVIVNPSTTGPKNDGGNKPSSTTTSKPKKK